MAYATSAIGIAPYGGATFGVTTGTSLETRSSGISDEFALSGLVDVEPAIVAPPATVTVGYIRRVSPVMPAPTLVNGVPQNWTATSTTDVDWFRWQVIIGGVDVTYYRNVAAQIGSLAFSEPFSEESAELRFPQITTFDQPNTGITWLKAGNDVTINRVYASDGHRERHWEGHIVSHEPEQDENGWTWAVHCEGVLRQAQHGVQTPPAYLDATDLGVRIPSVFNDMPARRYAMCPGITTGITTRQRGSLSQSRLQLAEDLLASSTLNDGSNDYTVVNVGHRVPKMRLKDLSTVNWVYTNGTPGLTVRLSYDLTSRATRIYGSGTRPDGGFWMGASYPTAADVYDMSINPLAEDATQSAFFPVERYTAYGEGITKTTASGSASAELVRLGNPGWTGTLTCRIDPEGGSRFEIREGHNVQLKSFAGSTILLHVARVEQDPQNLTVTLTVDTLARSLQSLAAVRARNAEAKQDPVGRARQLRRQSRDMIDKTVPFDSEAGAGTVPSTSCGANQWTRIRVPFGQVGDIIDGLLSTSPAVSFSAALWDNEVSLAWLAGFGDPLNATTIWDTHWTTLANAGWLEGWGDNNQAAGYSDSNASPATLTGKLRTGGFPYSSTRPPWVWLTVWPSSSTTISGSFTAAPPQV